MYLRLSKRLIDLIAVLVSAPGVLPIVAVGWVVARRTSGSSGFFSQTRIGRNFQPFRLVKLRTMRDQAGTSITTSGDPRITGAGQVLRRYKIDELPQLWNILRGDMSLVGPRPELPEWVARHREAFAVCLKVRPGLSDLSSLVYHDEAAQLAAADAGLDLYGQRILPHKLELARWYAEHASLSLDLRIVVLTLASIANPTWSAGRALRLAEGSRPGAVSARPSDPVARGDATQRKA